MVLEIIAGIIIGPSILAIVHIDQSISVISVIGLAANEELAGRLAFEDTLGFEEARDAQVRDEPPMSVLEWRPLGHRHIRSAAGTQTLGFCDPSANR